jgi:hypothetical protein
MIAGFFTAWPVNTWLIRTDVKEAMRPAHHGQSPRNQRF